ncbi:MULTISPECIES: RNA polymerase sigma factor RpoH [unclassified Bradyrhizobium]|uniref:RNA polymerase sigma factor RpoH n=1 Tax=unclassified Bradyrhizobium TaxID=2631580 RepID=UPI00211EFB3F|nr:MULTISPECIES: RNA polymerase sigma factor RpoH [unclassified Bradyrhizobium]MDD1536316.1 RNA polymerase sigma factor RpoH [Bradyrhizobium sp. WBOS8]MDD1586076.1 RNA polymerase sigma factor RpoH [Bradyrhizobium sp. WBOS4]UUO48173.1 RNA polymerase sigma factor RpoH [Bradyrhizobium sp. WBOS04]UUO61419.1 RNA polymerase sigma factor RpoH [Bradyrhizobium sp. WBOS08]
MLALSSLPAIHSERGLSRYLNEIHRFPLLEAPEEIEYARRLRDCGDPEAAYRLVTSHLRLAAKIALQHRRYGLAIADLISEANVGLMLAVKRFDPEKGFRLATYANWWIKAAVQEYILRSWSLVKLGTTAAQKKLFFNLRKLKSRLGVPEDGDLRTDQLKQIAGCLNVREGDVIEMDGRLRGDISLNVPLSADTEGDEWQDRLVDPSPDPESLLLEASDREREKSALAEALAALSPREHSIIRARYLDEPHKTLEDLAGQFGISRERIRQIEQRALQRIKAKVCARLTDPGSAAITVAR